MTGGIKTAPLYSRLLPIESSPCIIPIHKLEQEVYYRSPNFRSRGGVYTISELRPVSFIKQDDVIRYDYFSMKGIIDYRLACDQRGYSRIFDKFVICTETKKVSKKGPTVVVTVGDDMWMFHRGLFRGKVQNDQTNTLYLGLDILYIRDKIGRYPTKYEMIIQEMWYNEFKHLLDSQNKLKMEVWW